MIICDVCGRELTEPSTEFFRIMSKREFIICEKCVDNEDKTYEFVKLLIEDGDTTQDSIPDFRW